MSGPTVAVWKFASCDGCQLTILDCEDELLDLAAALDIRLFLEAGPATMLDHYDVSLVEGSITTPGDAERIRDVRARSGLLVTLGACATAGGIQALRNTARVDEYVATVYARPEWIDTLAISTPIAAHVKVDHELRGCPISKRELLDSITALLAGRRLPVTSQAVCVECKLAGTTCVLVAGADACLGPVTHGGCGALCPSLRRGCFGCFGPSESSDVAALRAAWHGAGVDDADAVLVRMLRTFNVAAPAFREADRIAPAAPSGGGR